MWGNAVSLQGRHTIVCGHVFKCQPHGAQWQGGKALRHAGHAMALSLWGQLQPLRWVVLLSINERGGVRCRCRRVTIGPCAVCTRYTSHTSYFALREVIVDVCDVLVTIHPGELDALSREEKVVAQLASPASKSRIAQARHKQIVNTTAPFPKQVLPCDADPCARRNLVCVWNQRPALAALNAGTRALRNSALPRWPDTPDVKASRWLMLLMTRSLSIDTSGCTRPWLFHL